MPFRKPKTFGRDELMDYALKLLGGRGFSIGDLKQKLRSRATDPADIDGVMSTLKQAGYLNDKTYADSFAASRRDNQLLGQQRVLRDLRTKHVSSTIAEIAVKQAFDGKDESALIDDYLKRKYRSKNLSEFLKEEKNLASAYRRLRTAGYSSSNSIRVLKRYAAEAEQLDGMEESEERFEE